VEQTLANVARTAVESFADLCLFDLIDENTDRLYVSVGAHRDPTVEASLKAMVTPLLQAESRSIHPARYVAQTGDSFFVPVFDERTLLQHASSGEHEAFMRRMSYRSKIVVPVVAQDAIFGALTFVRTTESIAFERADMEAAEELGRRAGVAVANAKKYSREQHVAETLQRAFLNNELPTSDKLQFNAVYQAAQVESALGGDWYDSFAVGDRIVVTIGDVTGKGVDAARLMVQLRQWIRLAAVVSPDPGAMLALLNRALIQERRNELATAFIGVIDREGRALEYASAGHPAPVLKPANGAPFTLPAPADVTLGVTPDTVYTTYVADLADIALVVLYTDGLTEIDRDPLAGEAALKALLAGDEILYAANPARFVTRLVAGKQAVDDLALLTVRLGSTAGRWAFDVADSAAAYAIKRDLLSVVAAHHGATADETACEAIFGELVGNVLRYAPGRMSLGLSVAHGGKGMWLHVMDEGPGFDARPMLPSDLWSESGRGLFLVAALSRALEIRRLPCYGTYVRVLLPFREPAPAVVTTLARRTVVPVA
jgi:anti-sigma regulatory factor (Ser/Thr protein kinase)